MMNFKQILLEGKTYQVGILSMVVSIIFLSFHYTTIGYTTHDDFATSSWELSNWWGMVFANATGVNKLYYVKFSQEAKDETNQFVLFAPLQQLKFIGNQALPLANQVELITTSKLLLAGFGLHNQA